MSDTVTIPADPCIEWWGARRGNGYGQVTSRAGNLLAHRAIWTECFGEIPTGMYVLHTCDNRLCVNPNHLYVGTHADNMRDMRERRRGRNQNSGRPTCINGHSLTDLSNVYDDHGRRRCRTCRRAAANRHNRKRRGINV